MRDVWPAHPEASLLLIGKDLPWPGGVTLASEHVRAIAGPFADRVQVIDAVPQPEVFAMLSRATVIATPSRFEPFGLATLEAMALGLPVIATTGSGFTDYLRHELDGLLVTPGDQRALAHAISQLLENPALAARLGSSAARRAEQFDADPIAHRHEELFAEIATRTARRPNRARRGQ